MKTRMIFPLLLLLINSIIPSAAQNRALLTIEDAVMGQGGKFAPAMLTALQWRPQTAYYTYVTGDSLMQTDARSDKTTLLLVLSDVNDVLSREGLKEMQSMAHAMWKSETELTLYSSEGQIVFDAVHHRVNAVYSRITGAGNMEESPVDGLTAYTYGNGLYIRKPDGATVLINDTLERDIVAGRAVHRNEFGITKGLFWSPAAGHLAYYRMDESMVADYPLVDITARTAALKSIKYPMAGTASHEVTLGIHSLSSGKTVFMQTGEPKDKYLTCVAWAPDAQSIYIALLNRNQNHLQLNRYSATTGELLHTLFDEKNDRYVEPSTPMLFLKTRPGEFIWQSCRDGHNHLYLYNTDGKLIRQLTKGEWDVTAIECMDDSERTLYYTSTQESPLQRHLYALNIKSGKSTRLTSQHGVHYPLINTHNGYFIDRMTSTEVPASINLYTVAGKQVRNLLTAENPYKDVMMPEMEMVTLTASDGTTPLYGRIIKPLGYGTNGKKHPVIVYVYGGPHAQLVTDTWLGGARLWEYYMAQKGYVMFTLDNRGSDGRGFNFESSIHRRLGELELQDQMTGIAYLKTLPFVDSNRIGVHGWSYGGFMTTSMMLGEAGTFKVGVAGGPVMDWSLYEVMYGERYMDTPDQNPDGYRKAKLTDRVQALKGKLLLIHGDMDDTVVMQHSLQFIQQCVNNNIPVDFFIYPQHGHNVRGKDRIHLMQKVTDYFDSNL